MFLLLGASTLSAAPSPNQQRVRFIIIDRAPPVVSTPTSYQPYPHARIGKYEPPTPQFITFGQLILWLRLR